jgi:nucleoside-diphosphate-sugar epimerase
MADHALVVGATGIVGRATTALLKQRAWPVTALSRTPDATQGGLAADLLDAATLPDRLAGLAPSHVFITTWSRQANEAENIRVNRAMVRNLLDALRPAGSVRHVALVTGLKHYLGPFESYGKGVLPQTPFREDQARLDVDNFYYAQEDEVFAAAERDSFTWSVHRPHTIIGHAVGNAMNMGQTLAVYASLRREDGRPFRFPGSPEQWNGLTDMTDAGLLARHLLWAATTPAACCQAFNVVNGDIFRWRWMWDQIAAWFGLDPAPFDGEIIPLARQMAGDAELWAQIADRRGLVERDLGRLASPWHTDADLGRPVEVVTDMSRSRRLGFTDYQPTDDAFFELFAMLREARLIP